jgi:hypothetical protein
MAGAFVEGCDDGGVVDVLDAALATVMPRPSVKPIEPATTPAAKSGRLSFMLSSFRV